MIEKNEKILLNIIKYTPSIFILIVTIVISIFLFNQHKKNIVNEKKSLEENYIRNEKEDIKALIDITIKSINDIKKNSESSLRSEVKNEVNNAYMIAHRIFNRYKNIKSKEEITELIKTTLRSIRHSDGRGYFFIYERKGTTILNAEFPHIEGKNLWNYKDAKGTLLLQEMYKIMESKSETFYSWYWLKPENKEVEYKKTGFFKKFEPYDWFIGTGEYVEDFNDNLKQTILVYLRNLRFNNDRYIFVSDEKGKILVNKYPKLDGKNIQEVHNTNYAEIKSKYKDGAFSEYALDEELTQSESIKKISYIKLLDDWNWLIGTGFDLNELNKDIVSKQKELEDKYNTYLNNSILISGIVILILLIISHMTSRYIGKIFFKYKKNLESKHDILVKAQRTAKIGDWKLNTKTMEAYWSDEIYKILGIKDIPKVVGPEYLKSIMYEEDWECFEKSILNTLGRKNDHSCIYRIRRPDNAETIWIDCKGQLSSSGVEVYGTIQDITQRVLLEQEKEEKEALLYQQSKMAAMGEMIGNIAHQWRQPLSIISSVSTGAKVQSQMGVLSQEDTHNYLDTINNTAQHLSQTIEDFRTFFDPKQNKIVKLKVRETVEKTLNLVDAQFSNRDIIIIKNIEDIEVLSLENELIQALVNILNNSKDALINIDGKRFIFITIYKKDEELIFEILDNANGIKEEILDRVFEPYFTTKHQSHGTGVGLYMTREIVHKLLKGLISVQNESFEYHNENYKGAKFIIKLPYKS